MNNIDNFMVEARVIADMLKRLVRDKIITGGLDIQRVKKYLDELEALNKTN